MSAENSETIQLLEKIVYKDRDAFKRFYELFSSRIYGLALRILQSVPEAEDVVQEVFYEVWLKASNYRVERGKPEAWLISIARSRAIDRFRSVRKKSMKTFSIDSSPELAGNLKADGNLHADLEAKIALGNSLDNISETQKQALELAYFYGMTHQEIAAYLQLPLGTVKTRVRDGLISLRKILKGEVVGSL